MVRDRLSEMQNNSRQSHQFNGVAATMQQDSNGLASVSTQLFDNVDETRKMIERASNDVILIKQKQSMILSTAINDPQLQIQLDEFVADFKRQSALIRQRLKATEAAIQQDERRRTSEGAEMRIRKTQHSQMTRRFLDVISDFNNSQLKFREMCKDRMKRQLNIAGHDVNDSELEDMLESGNTRVFASGIQRDSAAVRQALDDVTARHEDIKKLENNISELQEIFTDMAGLVGQQGEMVDRIEHHVSNTTDYVETAKVQMVTAREHQSASRRKKVYCIIIAIVIVLIIAAVIAVVLATQLKK